MLETLWNLNLGLLLASIFSTLLVLILSVKIFNRTNFAKFSEMDGKTVIITGATGGIGRETAKEIAKRGARLILACRNVETAQKVKEEIVKETKNEDIVVKKLDLASQNSIRSFAEDIVKNEEKLHVLIHNAGIAVNKIEKTEDGIELTMATNHFGPFLLTHLLFDLLKKSSPSRIVVVASELYRVASLNLENINPTRSYFVPYIYYVSKYANICFTKELARRLANTGVTANCLHPGLVNTGIWESAPPAIRWAMRLIVKGFFKNPEQGCQTSVYLASSNDVEGVSGKYFSGCQEKGLSSGASDVEKAQKLWQLSLDLVKLRETDPKI